VEEDWDILLNTPDLITQLEQVLLSRSPSNEVAAPAAAEILPPIDGQEVWAAGVTYLRSLTARVAEASDAGGSNFYDRVYEADRPEIFFKATAHRVVGTGQRVRIREDSRWTVPEPELAVVVNADGAIVGYTIGNDMSARDIEGANPLYLTQAKVYNQSCAIGPGILLVREPLPPSTEIRMSVGRGSAIAYSGKTTLASMKRTTDELVAFLFRDNSFPAGCILLTGTGIVPPDDFALRAGDRVSITIEPIGTLENTAV
jgi:2-dehydro-3-deoxy-D-arabinonate dehydratase